MNWKIVANVRRNGSIGIFYGMLFTVKCEEGAQPAEVKEAWHRENDNKWELNHFVSILPADLDCDPPIR